jgi:plastocyanin
MCSRFRIGLIVLFLALVAGGLSAVACGSSGGSATSTPQVTKAPAATESAATSTPTAGGQTTMVTIKDFEFTPASVTVKLGDTVMWTNDGPSTHTVTADDGSFESGDLSAGKTFSHMFQTAGTFTYHCSIHPFMTAEVIVQSGSSAAGPSH